MINRWNNDPSRYDDLLEIEYPFPTSRKRMSMQARGAQFAPFAALTGYEQVIFETSRLTEERIELSEQEKTLLDFKISQLQPSTMITVTYFVADLKKSGGMYKIKEGLLKKIDSQKRMLVFDDATQIGIDDIYALESPLFDEMYF